MEVAEGGRSAVEEPKEMSGLEKSETQNSGDSNVQRKKGGPPRRKKKIHNRLKSEKIWPHYMFLGGHFCHLANSHPRSGILKVLEAFFTLVLSGLARQVVKIRVCLLDF